MHREHQVTVPDSDSAERETIVIISTLLKEMNPSRINHISSSKKKYISEARNAGVGAFHVFFDDSSNSSSSSSNNNDWPEEPALETATVEYVAVENNSQTIASQQEQEVPQRGPLSVPRGESRWNVKEKIAQRAATTATSIRDAYLDSIKRKSCFCLLALLVCAIVAMVFALFYNGREADGSREFRGPVGSPGASPTVTPIEMHHYCDETRLLPAIDSETIATRTDRFQALQSVLATEWMDYDPTAFDEPCGPHNFALQWLADEDDLQLEPHEIKAVYQRFVVALFYFSTSMYSTILASHSNQVQSPWLSGEPECTWFGITCTNTQLFVTNKIISIELPGVDLKGSIPNALILHLDSLGTYIFCCSMFRI
jgi:hypothetical protein